jgi:hypothetical protein
MRQPRAVASRAPSPPGPLLPCPPSTCRGLWRRSDTPDPECVAVDTYRKAGRQYLVGMLEKALELVHLDFAPNHRQPSTARVLLATVISIAGSLLADALIVVIAQALIPGDKGYAHFQFSDYARLTVIGVVIACVAWPITTRITSQPRWMFFRMAAGVTLVLWLPDVYILVKGQPAKAVAFLFMMHLAIALVTYNALVHLAPVRALLHPSHRRAEAVRQ